MVMPSTPQDLHPSAPLVGSSPAERLDRAIARAVAGSPITWWPEGHAERTGVIHDAVVGMFWDELAAVEGVTLDEVTDWVVEDWTRSRTARMTLGDDVLTVEVEESWHPRDVTDPPRGVTALAWVDEGTT